MKKRLLYIGNKLSEKGKTPTAIDTLGLAFEQENFTVFYASQKQNQFLRFLDIIITTLFKCNKVDFVIIDTYSTKNFYFALVVSQICRLFKTKYIPILHGGNLPDRLKKNPYLSRLIFKYAYKNVVPSNYLKQEFSKHFNYNLVYIPNTIEIEKYHFNSREIKIPKLLWVRSFSEIYNPKMAIQVLATLKNKYPKSELCMVGPDKNNLMEECKSLAKALNVEVKFTGKLSKIDWIILSKDYNVFINTTHFDNTPLSLIEAMALGLPIVSTNVGGIPFLLKDKENAVLVDDNDFNAMANAVELYLQDNIFRSEIVCNARKLVENFDWNVVRKEWFKALN